MIMIKINLRNLYFLIQLFQSLAETMESTLKEHYYNMKVIQVVRR